MDSSRPPAPRQLPGGRRVPLIVLLVSLAVTWSAVGIAAHLNHNRAALRFDNRVQSATDRITARLDVYESMLRAGAAFFDSQSAGGKQVSPAELRTFVQRLDLSRRYPGVQGIGFTRRIREAELPEVTAQMQEEFPGFRVWPDHPRSEYHSIVSLEPLDARNRAAIGYDMFSEPVRHEAMSRARDTGLPILSGRVKLVQEIAGPPQAGFLIYFPVYEGGGRPATVEERREKLYGFIYAPFRADDLFRGIFGSESSPQVTFQVYDGHGVDPEKLLHRSTSEPLDRRPAHTTQVSLEVDGRPWTIAFQSARPFENASAYVLVVFLAVVGTLLSLALYAVTGAQVRARQRALEKAELAREAAQQREDFLSVASHELRTPLAVLKLLVNGVERTVDRNPTAITPEFVRDRLTRVNAQLGRLGALVEVLLDVSRIRAGRMVLSLVETDLAEIVREVAARMEPEVRRSGCTLELDADLEVRGRYDRDRIDQVVTNLLSNALKYGAGKPVEIRVRQTEQGCVISCRDHGVGIKPEDQARIFQRFERAKPTQHLSGLGLGLWIVREIVEAHGGGVEVESSPGEGATFTVTLPCGAKARSFSDVDQALESESASPPLALASA